MKAKDIDLNGINSLAAFYALLDRCALQLEVDHEITELLLKNKHLTCSDHEKQKLQWEVEASLFSYHGSSIFAFSMSNGKEAGEISEYPHLEGYQLDAFEYLKRRARESTSSLLKARYNHLLWKSKQHKHKIYAAAASLNYLEAIRECCKFMQDGDTEYSYLIGVLFENLVATVNEANVSLKETKALTRFLLFDADQLRFSTKHSIVEEMLKFPKMFKSIDFADILTIFERHLVNTIGKPDDFLSVSYYLPTAIKVAQKQKSNVKIWYDEMGKVYLRMAESEIEEERNWIKQKFYAQAVEAFRLSGNQQRKRECEQLYFALKPYVKLDEHLVDFDEETIREIRKIQDELKEKAKILLKESPDFIYAFIGKGSFFPNYTDVLKATKDKQDDFLDFATIIQFDNNKNISTPNPAAKERRELLETYGRRMESTLLPFLHYVIVLGIKSGHLTYKNFLHFLMEHTWIGKPHVRVDLGGNTETTNWVMQVAPSVIEFFVQVQAWGESKYYTPNFILCTDSLTLKIEGLFRNFSERLNLTTSIGKKKGMQEVLVHDVIGNDVIRKYFNQEDMLLFDYVFSNEGGLNLRNNIAHCFYSEHEYHPDKMLLLLAVLLRLGKYDLLESVQQPRSY